MNTEDNILLAEFMLTQEQFKLNCCIGIENGLYQIGDPSDKIPSISGIKLKYDTSWEWLVPVIEKIESKKYFFLSAPFFDDMTDELSGEHFCIIDKELNIAPIISYLVDVTGCASKKEAMYKACVEFVKWYKLQK